MIRRSALTGLTGARLLGNGAFRYLYPFLPVVARGLDVSLERAGLLVSALAVGGLLAPAVRRALTGGREASRRLTVGGLTLLTLGLAVAAAAAGFWVAFAGFLLIGLGKPGLDAGSIAYVAERTPYRRRAWYTSLMELTWAGGLIVVAPIAGVVIAVTSWRVPLAGLVVLTGAVAVWLRHDLARDDGGGDETGRPGRFDATAVLLLVGSGVFFLAQELTFVVFGAWLEADFGASVEAIGSFAAVVGIAELVGSSFVMMVADRVGKLPTAIGGLLVSAAGFASLPAAGSVLLAVVLLAVALLGFEIAIVAVVPVASEVWPGARSRFVTIFYAVVSAGRAVGAAAGPALFAARGIGVNVTLSTVGQLLGAAVLAVLALRLRSARTTA